MGKSCWLATLLASNFFPYKSSYHFNATDLNLGSSTYFFLLFSFLVLGKCQVLHLRVCRSRDQVLQRGLLHIILSQNLFKTDWKTELRISMSDHINCQIFLHWYWLANLQSNKWQFRTECPSCSSEHSLLIFWLISFVRQGYTVTSVDRQSFHWFFVVVAFQGKWTKSTTVS